MKNMNQIVSFVMVIALVFCLLAGCGHSEEPAGQTESGEESTSSATSETTTVSTQAPTETQPEPATAPDPDFYLNTGSDSTIGEYRVYCFNGNPTEAVQHYVSVLQDQYAMTLVESYSDGSTLGWHLQRGSNENDKNLRGLSDEAKEALAEPCSYNEIRAWFLKTYPAIANFHKMREDLVSAA